MSPAGAMKPSLPGEGRGAGGSGGLPPRPPSPADGARADSREASPSRLGPDRGEARAADALAASTSGRGPSLPPTEDPPSSSKASRGERKNAPSSAASLRRRARRVSDSDAAFASRHETQKDATAMHSPRSPRSRRRGARSLDRGSRSDGVGSEAESGLPSGRRVDVFFRSRVSSFHNLLQDSVAGKMSLRVAAQRVSDTLEAQMGKFGPGGVEIYRFAWERFNRRVVFHIVFYSSLGTVLGVLAALVAWRLWTKVGHFVLRRLAYVVASLFVLAMLPPSFPNAAAHFLSLVLVGAELVLVGINLVLFALVHLAVWLNKYILPHWFHGARTRLAETVSGVVDHAGRAAAVAARARRDAVAKLENATTYDEYVTYATLLDAFPADLGEGGQAWRDDAEGGASGDAYDDALVRMYESVCRAARESRDANALGLALRTVLHRNFAGVDRVSRLKHARFGTKRSAEAFVAELSKSVAFLGAVGEDEVDAFQKDDDDGHSDDDRAASSSKNSGPETRSSSNAKSNPARSRLRSLERVSAEVKDTLRLVSETHRSLGRTALCLSGGGALAMYHFGVIKTLLEQGLLPQVISGTSGGSIVAAFVSMFPEEELLKTIRSDLSSRHGARWFPPPWKMALHFAKKGTLMDGAEFAATTKKYFGDVTFAEAFAISKRAVSIQVSVGSGHGFVLNHFTAPQVVVRTAVNASCALPGLMEPFELLAKNPKTGALTPFHPPGVSSFDGTITADIPSARLTELFNCNNFIVSQVNPHVNFVLHLAEEGRGRAGSGRARSGDRRAAVTKLLRVANFLLLNIKYGVQKLLEVDLLNLRMVRTLQGILVQDFRGHVTVLPELRARDYARVLQHPSEEDMAAFVRGGERATWPHVEAIRASTAAEIALTEAATALRGRAREIDERLRAEEKRTRSGERGANNLAGTARTASPSSGEENARGDRAGDIVDAARDGSGTCTPQDDSFITQSDSASDREPSSGEDDAHLGAGLSCAVESAAWH